MKKIILCIAVSFLIISCSAEEENRSEQSRSANTYVSKIESPQNTENPFDQTGSEYYNLLHQYTTVYGYPVSSNNLANHMRYLVANSQTTVDAITEESIDLILAAPEAQLMAIIGNSSLSSVVKSNLKVFVTELIKRQEQGYDEIYNFIIAYENTLISDELLKQDERDTILKMTSISRYSLYADDRRKDRDWETAITTRPAGTTSDANERTLVTLAVLLMLQ